MSLMSKQSAFVAQEEEVYGNHSREDRQPIN